MENNLKNITAKFRIVGTTNTILPFGNGHINDTYLVTTVGEKNPNYILQRKNHNIFKDIPAMVQNIVRVTDHIRNKLEDQTISNPENKVITHIKTTDDLYYYRDKQGNYWVLFLFIAGCKSYEKIENPSQAFMAGKAFGIFQNQLADLPGEPLTETIKDFHNIQFRLANFEKAIMVNFQNRILKAKNEIQYAQSLADEMNTLLNAQKDGLIPERITHNDTKINNILFDKDDNILCVIDLDTVMPGLVHYDFGDAIRTAACTTEEDETNLSLISLNTAIFDAFAKGFLGETKNTLSKDEIKLLPHSAKFMAYIMGLRFLTDYIEGDVYYKIKHPEHNLERAKAQFKLVQEIENKMAELNAIISRYLN